MQQKPKGPTGKTLRLMQDILDLRGQPFDPEAYSRQTGIPVANLYRYLASLLKGGILIRPTRGAYLPHPNFLGSTSGYDRHDVFKQIVRPELEKLSKRLPVTLHFGILEADMVTYLVKVTPGGAELFTQENMQLEAYCSGIGKILLSALPEADVNAYLCEGPFPSLTPYTLTDPDDIRAEIEKTKQRGYGIDDREIHEGLICLAVPVVSPGGDVLGAISAASMALDILGDARDDTLTQLRTAANTIGAVF